MSAEVLSLPRGGAGARAPLVPARVDLREDAIFLKLLPSIFDSEWAIDCSRDERLAGITLRARALKQIDNAGSLPASDRMLARLADYGDDVVGWQAVKDRALQGWILCSDGRWHHPEIARNVLHIWIGRLESRRISAWGNKGRAKEGSGRSLDSIMGDMDAALDALAAIDPQDAALSRGADQQAKWRKRIAGIGPDGEEEMPIRIETPYDGPNRSPNRTPPEGGPKVRQAKRSQADSSSLQCRDDSSVHEPSPEQEVERSEGSAKRTTPVVPKPERAPPWPAGYFEAFKALPYPKREGGQAWGRAEKALDKIRKAQRVPFEDIVAGVHRLAARVEAGVTPLQYVPLPSTWLSDRGWEDEASPGSGRSGVSPPLERGRGTPSRTETALDGFDEGLDLAYGPAGLIIDHEPGDDP